MEMDISLKHMRKEYLFHTRINLYQGLNNKLKKNVFHKLLQNIRMSRNISMFSHRCFSDSRKSLIMRKWMIFWQISMADIKYSFHFFNVKKKGREIIFNFKPFIITVHNEYIFHNNKL